MYWVFVISLDFDVSVRREVGDDDIVQFFEVDYFVVVGGFDVVVESMQVCGSYNELEMSWVVRVKFEGFRSVFGF